MRRILIDTSIYVSFKRNDTEVLEAFKNSDLIGIDVCVLAELYCGFRLGNRIKQNYRELESFLNTDRVFVYHHDLETAEIYSRIYQKLKKKAKPVPTNDLWIAAVAMQHGLALFTKDQHFIHIDGLMRFE